MKVAVLDIGSNTAKALVVQKNNSENFISIGEKSFSMRLLSGLAQKNPVFSFRVFEDVVDVIGKLIQFSSIYSPSVTCIVGTEALRRMKNSTDLVLRIKKKFSVDLQILSGESEAYLVAQGLLTDPAIIQLKSFSAIDIGGGSLEGIKVNDGLCEERFSLALGAVVLAERFFSNITNCLTASEINNLKKEIRSNLQKNGTSVLEPTRTLVGTGGSLVFLRRIISTINNNKFEDENILEFDSIEKVTQMISVMDVRARITAFPELPEDRADIFPAALFVILEIMKFANCKSITHSFHNLRYGVASKIISNPEYFD
jgi:exopolyphosphatase/guanosine-5'-triphosphate,3'-diphosphate pyrophosphatase